MGSVSEECPFIELSESPSLDPRLHNGVPPHIVWAPSKDLLGTQAKQLLDSQGIWSTSNPSSGCLSECKRETCSRLRRWLVGEEELCEYIKHTQFPCSLFLLTHFRLSFCRQLQTSTKVFALMTEWQPRVALALCSTVTRTREICFAASWNFTWSDNLDYFSFHAGTHVTYYIHFRSLTTNEYDSSRRTGTMLTY